MSMEFKDKSMLYCFREVKFKCFTTGVCLCFMFKACVCYFESNFCFSSNDSPSKTLKDVFYFIEKALFGLKIFKFLIFNIPLSGITLEFDPGKIINTRSSTV